MARSAHFEGGRNTIARVFPAGTTGTWVIGKMPKNGKIVRIRYSGLAIETGLTAVMRIRFLPGTGAMALTSSTDISFASIAAALAGVEASFLTTVQGLRDAKDNHLLDVMFTGTTAGAEGVLIEVAFDPR